MPWSKEIVDVRYLNLLHFASQLKAGRGLSIVVSLIRGDPSSSEERKKVEQVRLNADVDVRLLFMLKSEVTEAVEYIYLLVK